MVCGCRYILNLAMTWLEAFTNTMFAFAGVTGEGAWGAGALSKKYMDRDLAQIVAGGWFRGVLANVFLIIILLFVCLVATYFSWANMLSTFSSLPTNKQPAEVTEPARFIVIYLCCCFAWFVDNSSNLVMLLAVDEYDQNKNSPSAVWHASNGLRQAVTGYQEDMSSDSLFWVFCWIFILPRFHYVCRLVVFAGGAAVVCFGTGGLAIANVSAQLILFGLVNLVGQTSQLRW